MGRKMRLKLTEGDKEFVKDLSRKLILRAYLTNSANRPKTPIDKLKRFFTKESYRAPVVNILDVVEKQKK